MLHVAFLLLVQAAAAEAPVLKGELKDIPAEGKAGPAFQLDGATNLPNGALIDVALYYGHVNEGRELAKDVVTVREGKFSLEFRAFRGSKKNLAGKYVGLLRYKGALQNNAIAGFADGRREIELQLGDDAQFQVESKAFRAQLAGEVQAMSDLGDQVRAKIDALKGKPAEDWKPLIREWGQKAVEIQVRASPLKVPEYIVLGIDLVATSGLENLAGILISAARYAAGGKSDDAIEGLTRLRQSAEYWASEVNSPRLATAAQIVQLLEAARKLVGDAVRQPDAPVLPVRRKFVEMNAILQKSLPEDLQPQAIEIGTRAAAFFNALSDKEPNAKDLHSELDKILEKLAALLRTVK